MNSFVVRNPNITAFTINDLGQVVDALEELDLQEIFTSEQLQESVDLQAAITAVDLIRLDAFGGTPIPPANVFDDTVPSHSHAQGSGLEFDVTGLTGLLGTAQTPTSHNQTASTITDFQTEVSANTDVSTNTSHRNTTGNAHGATPADIGAIASTEKGAANGVASLDASGDVPLSQLPDSLATDTELTNHVTDTANPHDTDLEKARQAGNNIRTPLDIHDPTGTLLIAQFNQSGGGAPTLTLWDLTETQRAILQRTTGNFSISVLGTDAQAFYKNCKIETTQLNGNTAAQMVRASDSGDGELFEFRADKTNRFYGKLDVDTSLRVGHNFASPYKCSVQSNTNQTWLEILNNGGTNTGAFFGMYMDDFELYNWQGGAMNFYTHPNPSDYVLRLQIKDTGEIVIPNLSVGVVRTNTNKELVADATTTHLPEGSNLYYTEVRVSANADVSANTTHRNTTTGNPHSLDATDIGAIPSTEKGTANGVATLDAGGKVPVSQLPASAIPEVHVVADATARLALIVQEGDEAIQLDDGSHWIYDGSAWYVRPSGAGAGDVTGPGSATDNAVARYDGTTGKLIQNSSVTIDDSGNIATVGTVDGRDVSADGSSLDGHVTNLTNPHATDIGNLGTGTLAELNSKVTDATLDDLGDARPPTQHSLGGSEHSNTSLAALNALIMGGDLDFDTDSRTPTAHNHTASEVSDFDIEVTNNTEVTANTAHKNTTTGNPHNLDNADIGLGNVTNDAQLTRGDDDWVGFSTKSEIVDTDRFLIEDSENGWEKTKVTGTLIKDMIEENDKFDAYDATGGTDVSSGWTDVPLTTQRLVTAGAFIHSAGSAAVTVLNAGEYSITARCTTDVTSGNDRSCSQLRIMLDTGSGYVEVPGTIAAMYNRMSAEGHNTGNVTCFLAIAAGDKLKIQCRRFKGTSSIALLAHGSSLSIHSGRGPRGQQGPAGTGGVTLEDEGGQVPNGPHNRLNFVGGGVSVVDAGSNEATITIPGGSTPVFGTEAHYVESLSMSSTTGSPWLTKLTLTTSSLPAGTYRVAWSADLTQTSSEKALEARVSKGGTQTIASFDNWFKEIPGTLPFAGFKHYTFSGVQTFTIQWRSPDGGPAQITNASFELWRIS